MRDKWIRNLPSSRHYVTVGLFYRALDVHREVVEAVDLECFTYVAKDEKYLHLNGLAARANWPSHRVKEAEITSANVGDIGVPIDNPAIEPLHIKIMS